MVEARCNGCSDDNLIKYTMCKVNMSVEGAGLVHFGPLLDYLPPSVAWVTSARYPSHP